MVGKHDAAGADPEARRDRGDLPDHDVGRGACDRRQVVMLGDPIARVSRARRRAGRGRASCAARRRPRSRLRPVKDRGWRAGARRANARLRTGTDAQVPILLPARQLAVAELQRDRRVDRIEAGNARRPIGEIDFRACPAGIVDERHTECARHLLRRHAEVERNDVGLGTRKRRPSTRKATQQRVSLQSRRQIDRGATPLGLRPWGRVRVRASGPLLNCDAHARKPGTGKPFAPNELSPISVRLRQDRPASSLLGRDQLHVRELRHLYLHRLCPPADVPGAEQELLHLEIVGERARSSHGLMKGLPSMVRFISHRPNGRTSWPGIPGGTLPSMMTMRPRGRSCFQACRSTVRWCGMVL